MFPTKQGAHVLLSQEAILSYGCVFFPECLFQIGLKEDRSLEEVPRLCHIPICSLPAFRDFLFLETSLVVHETCITTFCTLANPLDRFLSGSVRPAEVMAQRRLRHVWPLGFAPLWAEAFYPESAKLAGSVAAMVVMHVRGTYP